MAKKTPPTTTQPAAPGLEGLTSEQILAMIVSGQFAGASGTNPIGVPADYTADPPGRPKQGTNVKPRYFEGDEYKEFASLPPQQIRKLQMEMERLGLIPKGTKYRDAIFDDVTRGAARQLLEHANTWGLGWVPAMRQLSRIKEQFPDELGTTEPLVIRQSNPDDMRAALAQVAKRTYGKGAKPELVERLMGEWQRYEAEQQTYEHGLASQITAGTAPDSTTITEPPEFDTWAEARLRAADPESAAGHSLVGAQSAFMNLLDQTSGADEFSG